jgi:hypothetical protein
MGWISPRQLNDDPGKFLAVPHELHESIGKLMELLFPGFSQRLEDAEIHCLECEGKQPFQVIQKGGRPGVCVGYVGHGDGMLLRINDVEE